MVLTHFLDLLRLEPCMIDKIDQVGADARLMLGAMLIIMHCKVLPGCVVGACVNYLARVCGLRFA
jgi:hypothetical protein